MSYIIPTDPALEELRRQLRDNEITLYDYKRARAQLTEPPERQCDTPGCHRTADRMDRDKALCSACAMIARNKRR